MTATETAASAPTETQDQREVLGDRLFLGLITAAEMYTVHVGLELGLYDTIAEHGPVTAAELAEHTGIAERYAKEWLEQQAVADLLGCDDEEDDAKRRYHLDPAHAEVLTDSESPYFGAGAPLMLAGIGLAVPELADAFRDGRGVPYANYGAEVRRGIAAFNRPAFLHELGSSWLPSIPDVHEHLSTAPRARILDLGCGVGVSSIAMARAYPGVEVVGIDLDHASVIEARETARAEGLGDRVSFHLADATDEAGRGDFDLVTIYEALHDMGDPVGALRTARRQLKPSGTLLVADERVADSFTAPGDELERLNYAASVLHCLPATMAEDPTEANGTVLRAGTVHRWAKAAGFRRCEELPIDFPFWRLYRMGG